MVKENKNKKYRCDKRRKSGMNTYISVMILQHLIYYLRIGITIYYCKVTNLCGSNGNTVIVYFSSMGGRGEARPSPILAALESRIDIGQGISIGPGKFVKKNKRRALNKHRA